MCYYKYDLSITWLQNAFAVLWLLYSFECDSFKQRVVKEVASDAVSANVSINHSQKGFPPMNKSVLGITERATTK